MRYSANLNIIIKAIEKASFKTSRDFFELEILQSNPVSAVKFANAAYKRIKYALIEDLKKMRPDYNLVFSDGETIVNDATSQYSFYIYPIDGLNNLSRSLADCAISIALVHDDGAGAKNSVAAAVYKIIGGDLFYCEKGFGAYLNNRKIHVSKRNGDDNILACFQDPADVKKVTLKNFATRNYGCKTLEIGYLSSGKVDICAFKKDENATLSPFFLLIEEAKGKVIENKGVIILSNGNLGV